MHAIFNVTNKQLPIMMLNLHGEENYHSMCLDNAKALLNSLQQCIAAAELVESQATANQQTNGGEDAQICPSCNDGSVQCEEDSLVWFPCEKCNGTGKLHHS